MKRMPFFLVIPGLFMMVSVVLDRTNLSRTRHRSMTACLPLSISRLQWSPPTGGATESSGQPGSRRYSRLEKRVLKVWPYADFAGLVMDSLERELPHLRDARARS